MKLLEWLQCLSVLVNSIPHLTIGLHTPNYLAANDVQDHNRRRSILLSTCGAATYRLIRNLTTPLSLVEKTYKEIIELVQQHYNPAIVQRLKFNSCTQQQVMLRDHLVCGMNDTRIQRCHLSEPDLTFQKAFELIQAMESADKNTQDVRKTIEQPTQIHYIQKAIPQVQLSVIIVLVLIWPWSADSETPPVISVTSDFT